MSSVEPSGARIHESNQRRFSLRGVVVLCFLTALVSGVSGYWWATQHGHKGGASVSGAAEMYQCPMHPTVVQDHPGDCPICGMKLVKVSATMPVPGAFAGAALPHKETIVEGLATVEIDPHRQQMIGLSTSPVSVVQLGGHWRTLGRVVVDETRVHHVNVKVAGFVEQIYADFVGKFVARGTPLFSLYSPELLAAQDELVLLLKSRASAETSAVAAGLGSDTLVKAVRRKLALWDVPDKTLDRVAQTLQSEKTITFYSPASGVITKKDVVQGMKLDAGAMPYEIVDLSRIWVEADVYESELRFVREGMPATLTLNAYPNREFQGKTVFVNPMLDPATRTVKVRLSFANPKNELKPEMLGEVVLRSAAHEGMAIPADAVVSSGTGYIVFVALGQGKFTPRVVRLGETDGNRVEVIEGLAKDEAVVTRANFLIDSESRLRASLSELAVRSPGDQPEKARVLPTTGGLESSGAGRMPTTETLNNGADGGLSELQPTFQHLPHNHGAHQP